MGPQSAPGMITLSWLISAQMGSYSRTIRILCAEGGRESEGGKARMPHLRTFSLCPWETDQWERFRPQVAS